MLKYELTEEKIVTEEGNILFRIRALKDFGIIKAGDLGGFIESEDNLSHDGTAWVYDNAWVYGHARVYDNARVCDHARVYDNAWVCGRAWVYGHAWVYDNAWVCGHAWVCDHARVYENARVSCNNDYATISGFGTKSRCTTFFRCKDNEIRVACGCFYGTIEEFEKQVKRTREGKIAKEYLMIADLMKYHFEGVDGV